MFKKNQNSNTDSLYVLKNLVDLDVVAATLRCPAVSAEKEGVGREVATLRNSRMPAEEGGVTPT
jgi:hypothetical protein